MALPPLYKFLDIQGAKLTLGHRSFKHARPSDFNDSEDLTIQSVFPEETEAALNALEAGFTDVILRHLNDPPTCNSPMKEKVALVQSVYRTNPAAAQVVKVELTREGVEPVFDVAHMRAQVEAFIKEINEYLQGYRVLCVTSRNDSEQMWSSYAEKHKGIALRIEPNLAKDSKFAPFRPVIYREKRPSLYADTLDFISQSLFGDQAASRKAMLEKIVYSKTLDWKHECEYRLAIPMRQGEEPWNTLPYHSEEIVELYLGLEMDKANSELIISMARAVNSKIAVFRAMRSADRKLSFDPI